MIVIGLTGSIGMGKSTAAEMLRDLGIPVHDADSIVHFLLGPGGKAVAAVGAKFPEALKKNDKGEEYIDRAVLGRTVFSDRHKKKALEEILHPMVWKDTDRWIAEMKENQHDIVAIEVQLLFETGAEKRFDVTLCVSAPADIQKKRVLARPGMTSEKFDAIAAGQMPDADKRKKADYVIDTGGSLDDVRKQLAAVVDLIKTPKV